MDEEGNIVGGEKGSSADADLGALLGGNSNKTQGHEAMKAQVRVPSRELGRKLGWRTAGGHVVGYIRREAKT